MSHKADADKVLLVNKKKRSTLRASVSRDTKIADETLKTVTQENRENAVVLVRRLKQYQKNLADYNELIHFNLPDDELDADIQKSQEYDDVLITRIDTLESRLSDFMAAQTAVSLEKSVADGSVGDAPSKISAKLPKLELMKYDGNPLQWAEFWDDFESTIDSRSDLSIIDKFKHLKLALLGEALRIAEGYTLTTANYDQVKADLKERYGDPEIAIFAHFEALLAITPANHELEQLTKVWDICETHIRSLVALGLVEDTFGQVFCPILLSKLPKFVKMELHRRNGSTKWTLGNLRSLLKEEIFARDRSERTIHSTDRKGGATKIVPRLGKRYTSSLLSQGSKPGDDRQSSMKGNKGRQPCTFCAGSHASYNCKQYPTVASGLERARGKCSVCFQKGHVTRSCQNRIPCYYCKRENHHSSLCFEKFGKPQGHEYPTSSTTGGQGSQLPLPQPAPQQNSKLSPAAQSFTPAPSTTPSTAHSGVALSYQPTGFAITKSALVNVSASPGQCSRPAQLIFDDGSTMSFITPELAKSLGARVVGKGYTNVGSFGSRQRKTVSWRSYEVSVCMPNGYLKPLLLHEMGSICPTIQLLALDTAKDPILAKVPLAQPLLSRPTMVNVDILIGLDYYYDFVGPEEIRGASGLVLLRSPLGYITSGFLQQTSNSSFSCSLPGNQLLIFSSPPSLSSSLERFWNIEQIGIMDTPGLQDGDVALKYFKDTVTQNAVGRYEVHFPFKCPNPDVCDTYQLAYGRLRSQLKANQQNPQVIQQVQTIFDEQLKDEIIEKAPDIPQGLEYYMPHHCVVKPDRETTKIRIVFDASAKTSKESLSLNDCIHRGPVFLKDLTGILLRLRMYPIILSADIAKAFHQVSIAPQHRDVTRFLWLKNPNRPLSKDNVMAYRFARVPFGINASPFLLAGTIMHHLSRVGGCTANKIIENHYVDNVFAGKDNTEQALEYYRKSKELLAGAFMNLRQFYSNDPNVIASIPECDRGTLLNARILGIRWDTSADTFGATVGKACHANCSSKRQVLGALAAIYDPCGWYSPITVNAKLLMQEIWKRGSKWDEALPNDLLLSWNKLQNDLQNLETQTIPRYHACVDPTTFELHGFSDASTKAYAGAVYLVVKNTTGGTESFLIYSKSRVAPLKGMTVPRLELLGALITARLIKFVTDQLQIPFFRQVLWTDSTCVIGWMRNMSMSTAFIRNRVQEIKQNSHLEIRYVPSKDNPADLASRGVELSELILSQKWWRGPAWITEMEKFWPVKPTPEPSPKPPLTDPQEERTVMSVHEQPVVMDPLVNVCRFSSLTKLLRITCYLFRVSRWKKSDTTKPISAVKLETSLLFWLKRVQQRYLSDSLDKAKSSNVIDYSNLTVFLDKDGFLKCKGRFQYSDLPTETKFPILLPKKNPFTFLVIMNCHEKMYHAGVNHTLTSLRGKYWVPHGRSEVKSVLRECKLCRKLRTGPFRIPDPPPLPSFRVQPSQPFSAVGLDYLGPVYVQFRERSEKVWIALFTCAVTRAIHLEIVASLSTGDFLFALRRFVAFYGMPKLICSDNATTFHKANTTIRKAWKQVVQDPSVSNYCANNGIAWKFTTDLAPWMGGFYERLVAPVKQSLRAAIGRKLLTSEELQTVVYEISAVLNSRPLSHSGTEVDDIPITPAHLLFRSNDQFPSFEAERDLEYLPKASNSETLISHWRAGQRILDRFWHQWRNLYLLSLRQQNASNRQWNTSRSEAKLGQIVLLKDNLPRGRWKYGKITQLHKSADGNIRSATILVPSGKTVLRSLKLLYPLEAPVNEPEKTKNSDPNAIKTTRNVPKRASAAVALDKIRTIYSEEQQFGC